jgi:ferrous iron transport protein B
VSRYVGTAGVTGGHVTIEDLPGTYSVDPIRPDEQIMVDVLDGRLDGERRPDALLVVVDATTLRRSLRFVGQVLARGLPTCVVVTFTDEQTARQGHVDLAALEQALGGPVVLVVGNREQGIDRLRTELGRWPTWSTPALSPPVAGAEADAWIESVLTYAAYQAPQRHPITRRIDAVLLHPLWGTIVFLAVMVLFFQTVFTFAAPLQQGVESFFGWLATLRRAAHGLLDGPVGDLARSHGGHIELADVSAGVVEVRLHGACHGCPAARLTLRHRLEQQLRRQYPDVREVVEA